MRGINRTGILLGASMRTRRRRAGLSQEELGHRLQVSYQQVQKYETGRNRLSCEIAMHLALIFGCSLDELCHDALASMRAVEPPIQEVLTDPYRVDEMVRQFAHVRSHSLRDTFCALVTLMTKSD